MIIPPIKCQGIKTKLVSSIEALLPQYKGVWFEPFMGSGVVGFNIRPPKAVFCDSNPHIIRFYNDLKIKKITASLVRTFLEQESSNLKIHADDYYKAVRDRFNLNPNSLDFLFLNRCCFNGMMRFNKKGQFNVPFCKKNDRLSKSYITKIVNQIHAVSEIIEKNDYTFKVQDFADTIKEASIDDFIYCDPPYIDRYSDYFNSWNESDEKKLSFSLSSTRSRFILSTWHHNKYRENIQISRYWNSFNINTIEHFYHLGAKEVNRNAMTEAFISNF